MGLAAAPLLLQCLFIVPDICSGAIVTHVAATITQSRHLLSHFNTAYNRGSLVAYFIAQLGELVLASSMIKLRR